ncbi:hypothetical protein HU200_055656 [Digitaria exilis]|uniref:Uncharacterized protein n=1 Tax=Digitaria exilis TaxID=1010633 RepID=A0A835E4G0_9POAL|nr:hypothetical protein HU200_055656 [Digitaria exilis]
MAAARCFRGDRAALTALRLRRVVSFLRRHRLYDTAHEYARSLASSPLSAAIALPVFDRSTPIPSTDAAVCRLERRTGAFFDAAHFRRLLGYFRWADASSYALGFVTPGRCSREADALIARILIFRLSAAGLTEASRLYRLAKTKAVDVILSLAAKCPELKAKSQLPRCTFDPAYTLSLVPGLRGCKMRQKNKAGCIPVPAHGLAGSFMWKRLERNSLVYFDAAHLRKLVKDGRWEDAGDYMDRFEPLWEGEGTSQRHAAFMHILQHHAMLDYLACRGDDGGRTASSLFCKDNAAFREKFPEVAQRHDLYRSMASKQARESIDWDAIKLTTSEKLQELINLHPDLKCSSRMRKPQCTSTPSEIIPLGYCSSLNFLALTIFQHMLLFV